MSITFKIILFGLCFISCNKDETKVFQIKKEWKPVKHHFDTIKRKMVFTNAYKSTLFVDDCFEVWIYSKTGSSILKYIDKNKQELPENIIPLPNSKVEETKK